MTREAERLIDGLRNPEAYPHPTDRIDLVETHISWVLLTGPFAYKVKKPVRFPFLDFSTLERRKRFCDDELRLNRRLAPELYLDVVPIGGTPQAPRVGATPAIEYAVQMRQFPPTQTLEHLVGDPRVTARAIHDLAERLAAFHAGLPTARGDPADHAAAANLRELDAALDATGRERIAPAAAWTRAQSARIGPRLRRREREGAVRECHGDLHLRNLAWIEDRIVPFDCLEFDRALRCIDTLDEVAFLFMDLLAHRRDDLAFELLNRYLEITGDYRGLDTFRYYLVYRALVRSKVHALAVAQHPGEAPTQPTPYVDLAVRLVAARTPVLVITRGLSGSGKTTITSGLVGRLPAIRARSDVERKRLHGLEPSERSASGLGTELYSAASSDATYAALAEAADSALASGIDIIIDATFLERRRRDTFAAIARRHVADFVVLDCVTDEQRLRQRVATRYARGSDASEADLAVLEYQLAHQEPITASERSVTLTVDTSEPVRPPDLARAIAAHLAQRAPQTAP